MTITEILSQDFKKEILDEAKHTRPDEYERHWVEFPKDEKHYYPSGKRKYGKWVYGHKEAMGVGEDKDIVVHHKNHNKHDNRKCNLEVCTRAEHCKIDPNARKVYKCKLCGAPHYARGYCQNCYMKLFRKKKFGHYNKSKNYSVITE